MFLLSVDHASCAGGVPQQAVVQSKPSPAGPLMNGLETAEQRTWLYLEEMGQHAAQQHPATQSPHRTGQTSQSERREKQQRQERGDRDTITAKKLISGQVMHCNIALLPNKSNSLHYLVTFMKSYALLLCYFFSSGLGLFVCF